ncbi:hypothetical protein Tco_0985660 [Tanacetum coccineum]
MSSFQSRYSRLMTWILVGMMSCMPDYDGSITVFSEDGLSAIELNLYEWKPLRCSSCKVLGHVLDECPKKVVPNMLKNLKNHKQAVKGVQVGLKLDDDDLGTNMRDSELDEKGSNSWVVSSAYGTSLESFGSLTTIHLEERIIDLERQMLDEKLVLVDDDGKMQKRLMIRLMWIAIVKWTRCSTS